MKVIKAITCIIKNEFNTTNISKHDYTEIYTNSGILRCDDCGWYSWDGGEGFILPIEIKDNLNKLKEQEKLLIALKGE